MKTLFIGRKLISLESTASTNTYASELLANSEPIEGTAIMTEYQQHGRGQRGSNWISGFGLNLLVTFIFYPKFLSVKEQFYLNIMVSLSIAETLQIYELKNIKIKWPNDIYVGDQKIAGILIENTIKGMEISNCVTGIGLNINQEEFPEFHVKATSMKNIAMKEFSKIQVFEELSSQLEKNYLSLKNGNRELMKNKYEDQLYLKDSDHNFECDGQTFSAKISGVTESGHLQVMLDSGERKQFNFKEIRFL